MAEWDDVLEELKRQQQLSRIMLIGGLILFFIFVIIIVAKDMKQTKKDYEKTSWIYHKHERKNMLYCNICGNIFDLDHPSVKKCLKIQKKALKRFDKNTKWSFNYQTIQFEKVWSERQ